MRILEHGLEHLLLGQIKSVFSTEDGKENCGSFFYKYPSEKTVCSWLYVKSQQSSFSANINNNNKKNELESFGSTIRKP